MIRFRPIDRWDGEETAHRLPSPFTAGWADTVNLLTGEAKAIAPCGRSTPDVVIQLDVPESLIRLDGGMRAGSRVESPRVVVNVESLHGPLRYQCDRFVIRSRTVASWQANVRAIALGLEALRKVDRYGIAGKGEQYTGWTALPSGPAPEEPFTLDTAIAFILSMSTLDLPGGRGLPALRPHYRSAARALHPDVGGDTALFQRLQDAWRLIPERLQ